MIKAGSSDIKEVYAGNSKIKEIYAGSTKVWSNVSAPAWGTLVYDGLYLGPALSVEVLPYINGNWIGRYLNVGESFSWSESETASVQIYATFENGGEPVLAYIQGPNGYWDDTYEGNLILPPDGGTYSFSVAVG